MGQRLDAVRELEREVGLADARLDGRHAVPHEGIAHEDPVLAAHAGVVQVENNVGIRQALGYGIVEVGDPSRMHGSGDRPLNIYTEIFALDILYWIVAFDPQGTNQGQEGKRQLEHAH